MAARERLESAGLAEQEVAVPAGAGYERHRHQQSLSAGALGQAIDDVMRVGREGAGQPAHQGHEAHLRRREAGKLFDGRLQRAAVADTDQHPLVVFDLVGEEL